MQLAFIRCQTPGGPHVNCSQTFGYSRGLLVINSLGLNVISKAVSRWKPEATRVNRRCFPCTRCGLLLISKCQERRCRFRRTFHVLILFICNVLATQFPRCSSAMAPLQQPRPTGGGGSTFAVLSPLRQSIPRVKGSPGCETSASS